MIGDRPDVERPLTGRESTLGPDGRLHTVTPGVGFMPAGAAEIDLIVTSIDDGAGECEVLQADGTTTTVAYELLDGFVVLDAGAAPACYRQLDGGALVAFDGGARGGHHVAVNGLGRGAEARIAAGYAYWHTGGGGGTATRLEDVTGTGTVPAGIDAVLGGSGLSLGEFTGDLTGPDVTLTLPVDADRATTAYRAAWPGPSLLRNPTNGIGDQGDLKLLGARLVMTPEMQGSLGAGGGITASLWEWQGDGEHVGEEGFGDWALLDGHALRADRSEENDGGMIGQSGKAISFHTSGQRVVTVVAEQPIEASGNALQLCVTAYCPATATGDEIPLDCRLEWMWDTTAVELEVRRLLAADTGAATLLHPEDWLTTEDVLAVSFDAAPALDGTDNFDGFDCSSRFGLVALLGLTDPTQRGVWRIASPGSPPERLPDDEQPGEIQRAVTVRYPADRQLSANVGTWVSHDGGLAWAQVERRRVYHVAGIVSAFSSSVLVDTDDGGGPIGQNEVFLATGADESSRVGLRSTYDSGDQDNTYPWGYGDVVGDEAVVVNPGSSLHGTRWRCTVGRPDPEWTLVTSGDAGSLLAVIQVDGPLTAGVLPNRLLFVPQNAAITHARLIVGTEPSGSDLTIVMQERLGGDPLGDPIVIGDGTDQPATSEPLTGGPPLLVSAGAYEFDVIDDAGAGDLQLLIFGVLLT